MYVFMYIWGMEFSYCNTTAFNYLGSDSCISLGACEFQKGVGIENLQLTSNLIFSDSVIWTCIKSIGWSFLMLLSLCGYCLQCLGLQRGRLFCIV